MKTYILRDLKTVEPQKPRFAEAPDLQLAALTEKILSAGSGPALFIGLDVDGSAGTFRAPQATQDCLRTTIRGSEQSHLGNPSGGGLGKPKPSRPASP